MGREKRKGRLNKTGESASSTGAFIGFGAFANAGGATGSSSIPPSQESETTARSGGAGKNGSSSIRLSPIYTGSDQRLALLFPKIGQKRDAKTKTKALLDLLDFFQSDENAASKSNDAANPTTAHPTKKTKAEALSHFLYLFQTKLCYDNSTRVRAHAVRVCSFASSSMPKAWKNLTSEGEACEIHGILLCAKADLAAEVRTAAAAYPSDESDEEALDSGMWMYIKRILSYYKPLDMHADLFQKKGGGGGDGAATNTKSSAYKLSESQQEELEERYERIVGTVIEGLRLHLLRRNQQQPISADASSITIDPSSVKFLWKALASSKASLRRQTYALLSTVCQLPSTNNAQLNTTKEDLIDPSKISKLLSQSLASEKESANLGMLLETLLAFVVSFFSTKEERSNAMAQHFAKPLTKLFKKGCHGASPATSWTPTILPLVALLPTRGSDPVAIPPKIDLLTNAWEGQNHVVSKNDKWEVISAVAETASFLLAKEEREDGAESVVADEDTEEAFHKILAQCWIRSLQSYLAGSGGSAASRAHRKLGTTLANGWIQLDKASCFANEEAASSNDDNKLPSIIYNIREWFWNEPLSETIMDKSIDTTNLTTLLVILRIEQTKNTNSPREEPLCAALVLANKFRSLISTKSAAWVPTRDIYGLWIAILRLVPAAPDKMFVSDNGNDPFEGFVMNYLLPWMILHTSSRSDKRDKDLALLDVTLFHHISSPTQNAFQKWWDPLLREILAGKPDLEILTACLGWLLSKQGGGHFVEDLVAGTKSGFSLFCVSAAETAVAQLQKGGNDGGDDDADSDSEAERGNVGYCKTGRFLRACVGLETMPEVLVGGTVVDAWVDCSCPNQDDEDDAGVPTHTSTNPVLDTLVAMIRADQFSDTVKIQRVLLQSWRQGGRLWEDQCLPWLLESENDAARTSLIQTVGKESQRRMGELSLSYDVAAEVDDDTAWDWTERAYRLLRLCSSEQGEASSAESPSLGIVGLGDLSSWEGGHVDYLSTCLMRLIRHMDDTSSRWQLFVDSGADTLDLFVTILIGLSEGAEDPLQADLTRRREDSCAMLLAELEFQSFDSKVVQDSIQCCISKISSSLKDATTNPTKKTCQGIAVLSQLIEMRFSHLHAQTRTDSAEEKLDSDDVRVGDKIWYITMADNPLAQEPCTVVKIHKDLPEEVYFTIRLSRNGPEQERQTLGERLRKTRSTENDNVTSTETKTTVAVEEINDEEKRAREQIVGPIVDRLINSIDANHSSSSYEVYNIAIAQCGLLAGRGIGSLHYSVVQKLMELQKQLLECLSASDVSNMLVPTLWRLALALGFGVNVPASEWVVPLIGSNATDTLSPLMDYGGDEERATTKDINCAMAAWLCVCSPACDDTILRTRSYSLLFNLAARMFQDGNESSNNHYIALRAVEVGQAESHKSKEGESVIQESEAEALTELTKAFSMRWNSTEEEKGPTSSLESNPLFDSIMRASLSKRPGLMAIASRQCLDALAEALYEPSKQYYAIRVLHSYAKAGRPLFENADDDDLINPTTLGRLDTWAQDMLEDRAEELEDDVASVAQWVCGEQMNDVESWHEDHDIDDEIACGRMLSWLSFLDIADTATGKDSANRLAFTSYVSICKAIDSMLDIALIYCNIGSDRKVELDIVIPMKQIIETSMPLSKLAARVIFRSVEVFPTLSKHWWDSSCPKYLTTTVREFVEKQVSPDILKHAIKSIQNASAFGEMNVQGGAVTREVNATYVQDDFTLSVLIKLPLSFPFRRAEVDCSKTLGVPAHRWKRWSLQITQMLNNQGGTLKDALLLWKENVDKEFEGVEPCPVCYSVLHVKSHKLPNLECKTCKNQFHSDCLHEWFKSSGKSACVICQQPWSGTRI